MKNSKRNIWEEWYETNHSIREEWEFRHSIWLIWLLLPFEIELTLAFCISRFVLIKRNG